MLKPKVPSTKLKRKALIRGCGVLLMMISYEYDKGKRVFNFNLCVFNSRWLA